MTLIKVKTNERMTRYQDYHRINSDFSKYGGKQYTSIETIRLRGLYRIFKKPYVLAINGYGAARRCNYVAVPEAPALEHIPDGKYLLKYFCRRTLIPSKKPDCSGVKSFSKKLIDPRMLLINVGAYHPRSVYRPSVTKEKARRAIVHRSHSHGLRLSTYLVRR